MVFFEGRYGGTYDIWYPVFDLVFLLTRRFMLSYLFLIIYYHLLNCTLGDIGMVRTLRYGSRGDDVARFQQGLNEILSILPKLSVDGIYGQKTMGRTRKFQSQYNLVPDGIVGPITWGMFFQILQQLKAVLLESPPKDRYDALRPIVIQKAEAYIGKVNFLRLQNKRPQGIDFIKKMFKEVVNIDLKDSNFKKSDGSWTQEPIIGGSAKSWCGIFAVYCYRKAGINSVKWDLTRGKPIGSIKIARWSPNFVKEVKMADIGIVSKKNHHFIIKRKEDGKSRPKIESIDGNQWAGQILKLNFSNPKCHQFYKDNFNYYQLI